MPRLGDLSKALVCLLSNRLGTPACPACSRLFADMLHDFDRVGQSAACFCH